MNVRRIIDASFQNLSDAGLRIGRAERVIIPSYLEDESLRLIRLIIIITFVERMSFPFCIRIGLNADRQCQQKR